MNSSSSTLSTVVGSRAGAPPRKTLSRTRPTNPPSDVTPKAPSKPMLSSSASRPAASSSAVRECR